MFSLLNGDFINYNQIIPKSFNAKIELDIKEIKTAVDTIQIASNAIINNYIELFVTEKDIILKAKNAITECECSVETLNSNGINDLELPFKIAFNAKYLLDCLKNLNGDTAIMNINKATEPVIFETETAMGLILPIRIQQ